MENSLLELTTELKTHNLKLVTAESCTGGGLAYKLTSLAGSSAWFERGFVTYTNQSKEEMLGVKNETLTTHGAVSEQTVREMAEGALHNSQAQASIAITGIAGPNGSTEGKPVGTVWIAYAHLKGETESYKQIFSGTREEVRKQTIQTAIERMPSFLRKNTIPS